MTSRLKLAIVLVLGGPLLPATTHAEETRIVVREDFENGRQNWITTDPQPEATVWKTESLHVDGEPTQVLRVTGTSSYQPPFRSPHSIALLKDTFVSDFELEVELQSTDIASGGHRDLCLFWGYQDPAHFYYVHLGAQADPHSCQIFIVDGAARTKITDKEVDRTPWSEGWHHVKVVRRVEDGLMEVYFDDLESPLMTATDKTFTWGQVGLGTFDNHGNFDNFQLRGTAMQLQAEIDSK